MNRLFIVIFLINILLPIYQLKAEGNQPPSITTITGITRGKINTYYNYTFYATDPDNDDIYYLIHWGDSMVFYWMGPYKSGEKITISYCFQILPDIKYEEQRNISCKYFTSWFQYHLNDNYEYYTYIFGEEAQNDLNTGVLSELKYNIP